MMLLLAATVANSILIVNGGFESRILDFLTNYALGIGATDMRGRC